MAYSCPPGTRQLAAGRAQSVVEWSRLATFGQCFRTLTSQLKATPRRQDVLVLCFPKSYLFGPFSL